MAVPLLEPDLDTASTKGQGRWMTVIHNDDDIGMDEVIEVLMAATGCDVEEAYMEMWEAHTFGKAPCHFASQPECAEVAGVISGIGVTTEVLPEWEDA